MASRRALTGGSGDVNPQFISFSVVQTGTDTTTNLAVAVPIQRLSQGAGRAQVLEVLCVKYETSTPGSSSVTELPHRYAHNDNLDEPITPNFPYIRSITVTVSTRNPGTVDVEYSDPAVFSIYNFVRYGQSSAGTGWFAVWQEPYVDDLTDGAGHGFLVATDYIYIQIRSQNTNAAQRVYGKLYYRWKNVTLQEYIGIVQGQQ